MVANVSPVSLRAPRAKALARAPRVKRPRRPKLTLITDPVESAKAAGLRYTTDEKPGITRRHAGKHFRYLDPKGAPVRDEETLRRVRALAIPPAWTDVWICPLPSGHLQATGRDAKGRKQYRYHPRWREVRDETKYERMIAFAHALPKIRARVEEDLALPGLPRAKLLATVVRLLEATLIRVGNEEYARKNHSFGLTTMKDEHVEVKGARVRFRFRGKSGKDHDIDLHDRRLARIVARCQALPGEELFQYVGDDGEPRSIESGDVNEYLREISGEDFTAKDFRTWAGTVLAAVALRELERFDSQAQAKKNVVEAIRAVSRKLGNTPSVCRKCYVHPAVLDGYFADALSDLRLETVETLQQRAESMISESLTDLRPEEAAVLVFLQQALARQRREAEDPAAAMEAKLAASIDAVATAPTAH